MPPDCRSSSQLPLRLVILPFSTTVAPFLHTTTLDPRTPDLYNSHHHSHSSIAALIPSIPHVNPSHHPSYYRHWLPVITSSRHLSPDDIHIITLPRPYAAQLLHAGQFGIQTLRVHESDKEDLSEEFPRVTTRGVRVADLFGASGEGGIEKEYFLRTDACSVKDGKNGTQPIRSVEDIWTRLATSHRVIHGLEHLFGEGAAKETEAGGEDKVETGVGNEREEWLEPAGKKEKQAGAKAASIDLYLIRFNPHITSAHEYRVFCPPPSLAISAVSQYRWFSPFYLTSPTRIPAAVDRIFAGIQKIHAQILESEAFGELEGVLREEGFTFDVWDSDRGESDDEKAMWGTGVQLVEVNPFGAMSGCGSALFHWERDARVLYGVGERDGVEFRVTV